MCVFLADEKSVQRDLFVTPFRLRRDSEQLPVFRRSLWYCRAQSVELVT